jgi:hypothetical protein
LPPPRPVDACLLVLSIMSLVSLPLALSHLLLSIYPRSTDCGGLWSVILLCLPLNQILSDLLFLMFLDLFVSEDPGSARPSQAKVFIQSFLVGIHLDFYICLLYI